MDDFKKLPEFDDSGVNILDPNDNLGYKKKYISLIQEKAILKYVGYGSGKALDIGCGYGRLARVLGKLGYSVTGIDPSEKILKYAKDNNPENYLFLVGGLPNLPVPEESFDLVCLFHVATRPLHFLGIKDICQHVPKYVKVGGKLIVMDNIKFGDDRYIDEPWFNKTFERNGLKNVLKIPIRASRWPIIYMIRYGIIPECWFNAIAEWELERMKKKKNLPKLSYYNYLFIYEKK
jgi:SAM-dependent methyltransferase